MRSVRSMAPLGVLAVLVTGLVWAQEAQRPIQVRPEDMPWLPGGKWRVNDRQRPQPRVVTPGPALEKPVAPPSDAIVLFDGKDLSGWVSVRGGGESRWKVENGYMEIAPRTSGAIQTKGKYGDGQYHIEWAAPAEVRGNGQGRGNSGVKLLTFYEIQILDSYDNITYADGQAGALYGQYPPLVNVSRKPGEWQSFDIIFEGPRFKDSELIRPAHATVFHNGLLVHHRQQILGWLDPARNLVYKPHEPEMPLMLQDHGRPVRFRNIWYRPIGTYDADERDHR